MLAGIGGAGIAWLILGAGCAIVLIGCGLGALILAIGRWLRGLPALTGDGDGQGGIPAERHVSLAELTVSPAAERWLLRQPPGATAVCTRCARDDTGLPCACPENCYAAYCMGGFQ